MRHFDEGEWVDFVRGMTSPPATDEMTVHLAKDGCERCGQLAAALHAVLRVALDDAAIAPAPHVVRNARAIFALRNPEHLRLLPRLAARMVFDSFANPLPVGLRAGQPGSRQMLYEAGPYAVDVRLEHARGSRRVWLTGQIATENGAPTGRLRVQLTAGDEVAAEATTNRCGEFQLQYEPRSDLQLRIDIDQYAQIELPLCENAKERES